MPEVINFDFNKDCDSKVEKFSMSSMRLEQIRMAVEELVSNSEPSPNLRKVCEQLGIPLSDDQLSKSGRF